MALHLRGEDYRLFAGVLLAAVGVGLVFMLLDLGLEAEILFRWATGLILLVSLFVIYKSRETERWGGEVGRSLEIIGAGIAFLVVEWVPHIGWHMQGILQLQEGGSAMPAWLGIPGIWWLGFFHAMAAGGFGIVLYGLYRFWRTAEDLRVAVNGEEG